MIQFSAYKMLQTAEGEIPLDVSFSIMKGEFVTIYGNSGAGKTTLLRILAGLTKADKSFITVENEIWDDSSSRQHFQIQKRAIGFVFQDYALFPNLTVRENLMFALGKNDSIEIVKELISLMELDALQNSKPKNLSGGQKQRVALARAIIRKPKILLLDEPLSALDDDMRFKLQEYILKIHQKYQLTTLMITHSISEIFKLSNKVIHLDKGKIIKEGIPANIFSDEKISSKFRVIGEIINISKSDIVYIVQVLSNNTIIKVIANEGEVTNFKIGQKVLVASKAFNPIIQVIS